MIGCLLLLLLASQSPAGAPAIQGVVTDDTGAVIAGATILVAGEPPARRETSSGADGRFSIEAPDGPAELIVRAPGFAESRQRVDGTTPVVIVLRPAPVAETVTVAGTRSEQRTGDVPGSLTFLSSRDLRRAAAVTADDALRQVPSFSLFRRTSSLVSHPTTQGVSLRGIGPSGVSRTLVLVDGVPANDPFGGWVYWSRIPAEQADRVEIAEGPSSSLYGGYAMGGVINIVTAAPAPRLFTARAQYGGEHTSVGDVSMAGAWQRLGVIASVDGLHTNGYVPVAEAERGSIDTTANVSYLNGTAKLTYDPRDDVHLFARGGYFHENRNNGKVSSIDGTPEANATWWRSGAAGVRFRPSFGEVELIGAGSSESFRSNFLAVPASTPPRSVARATLNQQVPATAGSFSARWTRTLANHVLTAGLDWQRVTGESQEDALDAATGTVVTLHRASGGREQNAGLYVQDMFVPHRSVTVTAGARVDWWRAYDGHNLETAAATGQATSGNNPALPDQRATVGSPRAAVLVRVREGVQVWAGAGGGFRSPTLNELYRQFRVGATLTLPNAALGPEHLAGYEGGVTLTPASHVTARVTLFDNRLRDPVSNVTISTSGTAVVQQRQNLGRTHAGGVEADTEYRAGTRWIVGASYIHMNATVTENPADAQLVGRALPQVPSNRGSARVVYSDPRIASVSVSALLVGAQYDDDRNTPERRLGAYGLVDLNATRALRAGVELFVSVQNLFDRAYATGTLPTTMGLPRLASVGIRVRTGGR